MRLGFALALAFTTAACPGDDSGGPGSYVSVDDMPAAFRDAYCEYLARCGLYPDKPTCLTANLPVFTDAVSFDLDPNVIAAIKGGRIIFNGSRLRACFDAIAANSCDTTDGDGRNLYQRCWNFLSGTVAAGQACLLDEECISQQCSGMITDTQCVPGSCIGETPPALEPAELGMPCRFNPGCTIGGYCDVSSDTCLPLKRADEECATSEECGLGLACAGTGIPRFCKKLPVLGEMCPDLVCRDTGTYCGGGTCKTVGLTGAPCTGSQQCSPAYPCDTSMPNATCKRGPGVGQPCASSTTLYCFDAGSVCDSLTFTCIAPKPDGMACNSHMDCASGHCAFASGLCAPAVVCR